MNVDTSVRRIRLQSEGVNFSALTAGGEGQPWVICLHGIPASAELWRGVLPILAGAGFYAVAPDLAGFGETTYENPESTSLSGNADALCRFLLREHPTPIWWVGHDLGGVVTQLALQRYPERFSQVTFSNCPFGASWPVPSVRKLRLAARLGLFPTMAQSGAFTTPVGIAPLKQTFGDPTLLTPAMVLRVFWDSKIANPEGRRAFAHFLCRLDEKDYLQKIRSFSSQNKVSQVIWGMKDVHQPWPLVGHPLAAALGTQYVTKLDGVGHFVPVEAPQAMGEALVEFGKMAALRR